MFYLITILWIAEFLIFPSSYKGKDKNETKSFLIIMAAVVISHILSISFSVLGWFTLEKDPSILTLISYVTYPLGLLFRYVSIIYLGQHFTRDVEVSNTQELVSKGPYRLLRHPLYLGLMLLTVSVPMFFGNWFMTIMSFISMFVILNHRMTIEENMMEDVIGDAYVTWKEQRYRFIPYIY